MHQTITVKPRRYRVRWIPALVIITLLGLPISASTFAQDATPTPVISSDYWPTDDWQTSSLEDQHMDSQLLTDMLDAVKTNHVNLHSLLVIRHGYIVSENYFSVHTNDELHDLYSVTKSFVSTLVGIAIDQGYIDSLDHPVLDYFPDQTFKNVDDRKKAMTLGDLMTMQSGLGWNEALIGTLFRSKNWVEYVLSLPMVAESGTTFNYCTGCSHVVSAILQKATQMDTREFAGRVLFDPLGITDTYWGLDPQNIPIGGTEMRLKARDMAKLGYLFLHNGEWDGQTIVSSDWVQNATTTHVKTGEVVGTGADLDYGLMWWNYPRLKGYVALGYNGQTVFVIPDLDLMIITTASTLAHDHDEIFALIEKYVVPAVKDLPDDFLSP